MALSSIPNSKWETIEEEFQETMAVFPDIVRDLKEVIKDINISGFEKRIEKLFQYNIPTTKRLHSVLPVYTYKSLVPNEQLTEDNLYLARILGWCMDLTVTFTVIIDDIMDKSEFRQGHQCWYRHNNVGLMAINDGFIMENATYYLIQKYFKGKECYNNIVEIFQDGIFKQIIGQSLDMYVPNFSKKPNGLVNLDLFTMDVFNSINDYKAGPLIYIVPVIAAMYLAGIKDPEIIKQSKTILFAISRYYQIQDDYLGCFGDFENICKDNSDIEEGKCTWLIVTALQHVTPEQRKILDECYGVSEPEKVKRVKQLFIDLDLPNIYLKYEEETYNLLTERIKQMSCGIPHSLFLNLLEKLYRRQNCLH